MKTNDGSLRFCINCKHFIHKDANGAIWALCERTEKLVGKSLVFGHDIYTEMQKASDERGSSYLKVQALADKNRITMPEICGKEGRFFEAKP